MIFLANLAYLIVATVTLPIVAVLRMRQGKSLRSWPAKFLGQMPFSGDSSDSQNQRRIWVHAVSVGEVNLISTWIEAMRVEVPDTKFFVSTSTDTGHELAKKRFPDDCIFYCPWDFSWAIRNVMKRIRPDLVVLAELEIWPNLVRLAAKQQVPVAIINGRLSEKSYRGYQRFRRIVRPIFSRLNLVAAQNNTYADRFIGLGTPAQQVHVCGSIKFDGADQNRDSKVIRELRRISGTRPEHVVLLAGSTQEGEDETVLDCFASLKNEFESLRLIIAPRHPHRAQRIADAIRKRGLVPVMRSDLGDQNVREWNHGQVLIIDGIGELSEWWGLSEIAFVGGSLGSRGGQNMIEPAAKGNAVCFGPNTSNFKDVVEILLEENSARVVEDGRQLADFVRQMLDSESSRKEMAARARKTVAAHRGATAETIALIQQVLDTEFPAQQTGSPSAAA